MGCCISHYSFFEKETVYEVTLDANGVAQRVPKGQGTHFIHVSPNNETHLEEKSAQPTVHDTNSKELPSLTIPMNYNRRVQPLTEEKKGDDLNEKAT